MADVLALRPVYLLADWKVVAVDYNLNVTIIARACLTTLNRGGL
jgi:hypothetical protein